LKHAFICSLLSRQQYLTRAISHPPLGRRFILVTSKALLDELDEKLRGKFAVSERDALAFRAKLEGIASVVDPDFELNAVPDDPDDNRVLECALAGKADYIVSGDRHLLRIASFEGIAIVTVRRFLETAGFQKAES
jgi:putative PIN family toxin of toxin-antitoxin system